MKSSSQKRGDVRRQHFGFLYLSFIVLVIFLSDLDACGVLCAPSRSIWQGDKLGHFVLVGALAAVTHFAFGCRETKILNWSVSIASVLVFCFITLEEFSQIWIPSRTADVMDLICSYLGILCFEFCRRDKRRAVSAHLREN